MPNTDGWVEQVTGLTIHGITDREPDCQRVPTVSFTLNDLTPELLVERLNAEGIFCWAGHNYAWEVVQQLGIDPHHGCGAHWDCQLQHCPGNRPRPLRAFSATSPCCASNDDAEQRGKQTRNEWGKQHVSGMPLSLVLSLDADLYEIIILSLKVSLSAVLIACLVGIPTRCIAGHDAFCGQGTLSTLCSMP